VLGCSVEPGSSEEDALRRQEREITDRSEIDAVIRGCEVCRLGLCDGGVPYVVPVNFGYDGRTVYVHTAREGRKLDIIRRHPRVCVEWDRPGELVTAPKACGWTMRYRSVIAMGTVRILEDDAARRRALDRIMAQYGGEGEWTYGDAVLARTRLLAIELDEISGKCSVAKDSA